MIGLSVRFQAASTPPRGGLIVAIGVGCAILLAMTPTRARADEPSATACAVPRDDCSVLTAVIVDGVTAYRLSDIAPLYSDHLTREVTHADLVRIAQAITDKYRADGYFLSRAVVPPQDGPRGQVRLRVYEGYLGDIQVSGAGAPTVRKRLAPLVGRKPLRIAELDRALSLATDTPGVQISSRIEPDLDDPARHKLVIKVSLDRLTGSYQLDNRGADYAGPWQAYLRAGLNSAIRPGDQLSAAVLTVPGQSKELLYGEMAYFTPLAGDLSLRTAVSASSAEASETFRNTAYGTDSSQVSLRLSDPLIRSRNHSLWGAVAFDARHVAESTTNGRGYSDDLRVLRAAVTDDSGQNHASTDLFGQVSVGLGGLGASSPGPGRSRIEAGGDFWKVNVHASHYRDLGSKAGVYLAADAQWTPDPLLLSEQFAVGGAPYGRAYNYSETTGDRGVAALAELRVGWDPRRPPISFFQTYAFVDAARTWSVKPRLGAGSASLASTGVGLRLSFGNRLTLRVEAAKALSRAPFETGNRNWRGFLTVSGAF